MTARSARAARRSGPGCRGRGRPGATAGRACPTPAWARHARVRWPTSTAAVLAALGRAPAGVDRLAAECGLPHALVAVALAALGMDGLVAHEDGGVFRAASRARGG